MAENESNKGCLAGLAYLLLSYPINWLYLRFVFIPYFDCTAREAGALLVMSPVMLPIELVISFIILVFKYFTDWLGKTVF